MFQEANVHETGKTRPNSKNRRTIIDYFVFRQNNLDRLCDYPGPELKKLHGRKGKKALKCLADDLALTEFSVQYNPLGMIDAGYLALMGMWNDTQGIYVSISSSSVSSLTGGDVLYRTIGHMKDYTGGSNNFLSTNQFIKDYSNALSRLLSLKKQNGRPPVKKYTIY